MQKKLLVMLSFFAMLGFASATTYSNFTVYWSVASSYDHTISFNANCAGGTAYFVENDAIIDGNQTKVLPYSDSSKSAKCQSSTAAYFTVTSTGSATTELDANISYVQGKDANAKLYLSSPLTPYCGDDNCNGWEAVCSVTDGAVATTTCLKITNANKEFYSLGAGTSASFCVCADFAQGGTKVPQGDWVETVGITSRAAD